MSDGYGNVSLELKTFVIRQTHQFFSWKIGPTSLGLLNVETKTKCGNYKSYKSRNGVADALLSPHQRLQTRSRLLGAVRLPNPLLQRHHYDRLMGF